MTGKRTDTPERGVPFRTAPDLLPRTRRVSEASGWSAFEHEALKKLESIEDSQVELARRITALEDKGLVEEGSKKTMAGVWKWVLGLIAGALLLLFGAFLGSNRR